AELAGDKARTKAVLERIGLPVPRGTVVTTADAAVAAARELGGPVVAKPLDGNHGRGVTLHLLNDDEVREGFEKSARIGRRVLIERQLVGRDYRLLIVGGRMVAAAERMPAGAVGDGSSTVEQLIEALNADPRRGAGHAKVLSRILVDDDLLRVLGRQGLTLDAVPESGRAVGLRDAANLSAGGEAIDRTDEVHPTIREAAEQAAGVIGLDIAGIDLIAPDIAAPLDVERSGIVEVNAGPGFRMHLAPSVGEPRDVAAPVIELLHPRGTRSTIPVLAVTGSNGKSTVVRMLGRIFERNGARVGMTTTVGVEIGGRLVKEADASGPRSARQVLADPNVDVAVLETARGGILREGLGYGIADVGVVLNVTGDHLGVGGVRTLGELAKIKSVVIRNVRRRGTSVLNADDPLTLRMTRVATGRIALFTMRGLRDAAPEVSAHAAGGDLVGTIEDGVLTVHQGGRAVPLVAAAELPSTIGGIAEFNVQNALAAAVAATAQGVAPEAVVAGLRDFESTYEDNPGRLNITRAPGFTTIVDYGHNPPALRALGRMLERMRSDHDRLIGVVSTPGDRRDEDIREVGAVAAGIFDELVFRERPDGRGRAPGGVLALLMEGATAAGMPPERISQVIDEPSAMQTALEAAGPRDLVVLLPTDVAAVWRQATTFTSRWRVEAGS
ncbi:MAG TPA: cyanophycin synthetase, partial [Rhodoglobus sp.]|nr:cyanophycin synthetase [Rhodoglobus sp.]